MLSPALTPYSLHVSDATDTTTNQKNTYNQIDLSDANH